MFRGAVCMIEDENHTLPSETDIKLVQVAAAFGETNGIKYCAYCTKNTAHFCTMCYIGRNSKKGLDFSF